MKQPNISLPKLEKSEALRMLGYLPDKAPVRARRLVGRALLGLADASRPRVTSRRIGLAHDLGAALLPGRLPVGSRMLCRVLGPCHQAEVFVLTLGERVDQFIGEASGEAIHFGFIVDALASRLAERLAEAFHLRLEESLGPDQAATFRYSPGYCDWPIEQQAVLFGLMNGLPIEVALGRNFLMRPRKSISGIVGIGPRRLVEKTKNACLACRKKECNHRRTA